MKTLLFISSLLISISCFGFNVAIYNNNGGGFSVNTNNSTNPAFQDWVQQQQQNQQLYNHELQLQMHQQQLQLQQEQAEQQKKQFEQRQNAINKLQKTCNDSDLNTAGFDLRSQCQSLENNKNFGTPLPNSDLGIQK